MFPMTHIWFSKRVLGHINNMTILGAVFPDIVITGCLEYSKTHNDGWGLYRHVMSKHRDFMDFADGVVTHTVNPRGLDFYGDEEYGKGCKGYCFQKAAQIEAEVIDACRLPREYGLWKAHNFIEMGIEINIIEKEQELIGLLYGALRDSCLIEKLAVPIESYYELERHIIPASFRRFAEFIELRDLSSRTLAAKYDIQMRTKHGISIDVEKSTRIIESCKSIVAEDFDSFIDNCTEKISTMLERRDIYE